MVERVTHLGFEVRVELSGDDGEQFAVQLTRDDAERLELEPRSDRLRPADARDSVLISEAPRRPGRRRAP